MTVKSNLLMKEKKMSINPDLTRQNLTLKRPVVFYRPFFVKIIIATSLFFIYKWGNLAE